MKKIAYTFLILTVCMTLFYNAVSYYMMYAYQKEQSWIASMQKIPDTAFKVIKVNATLYSFTDDTEMEFVNENVTIKNKTYHIFKKQIKDNIVSLYYLRNHSQDSISEDLKHIVDDELYASSTNKPPLKKIFKTVLPDYVVNKTITYNILYYTNSNSLEFAILPNAELHSGFLKRLYSPPEMV